MEKFKNYIIENFDYSNDFISYITSFDKIISFSLKKKINGKLYIFNSYRVQHNNDFGIYKGGFRIYENVSLNDMKTLSFLMTVKNRLYKLPFGGAKGGIRLKISNFNQEHISEIVKDYITHIVFDIGEDKDVIAPDIGTNSNTMGLIFDHYKFLTKNVSFSVITGKPEYLLGISYRKKSTGYGVAYFLDEYLKKYSIRNPKIGIHGFGKVGFYVAEKLINLGYKICGVCDSKGGILTKNLDLKNLRKVKKEKGSVINYPAEKKVSSKDFLEEDFDVLILASVENVINKENVKNIKSKLIVEGANFPVDIEIEDVLLKKGINILPDIMVNGGGVYISYFEWVKGKSFQDFKSEELDKKLRIKVKSIFKEIDNFSIEKSIDYRKAAYKISLDRFNKFFMKKFYS